MKEKKIFEQFLKVSQIDKEDVVDYRYCTKIYAGIDIPNSITIQLKKDKYEDNNIIYTAFDIDKIVSDLRQTMCCRTEFEQGYHSALDELEDALNKYLIRGEK